MCYAILTVAFAAALFKNAFDGGGEIAFVEPQRVEGLVCDLCATDQVPDPGDGDFERVAVGEFAGGEFG